MQTCIMEPVPPTVCETLAHCEVTDSQLDNPCSNEDINAIAGFLVSWKTLAPHLGLDESEEEEIEEDGKEEAEKSLKALRKWKTKFAHKATYKVLVEALVKVNMAQHALHVCQLVKAHFDPLSRKQLKMVSSTDFSSESDGGCVGEGEPQTQPLATIPTNESEETGEVIEDRMFELSGDFADMYCKLVPLLARTVNTNTLKRYLRAYRHPTSKLPYIDPSIYSHCTTTEEILDALQDHCYYHPTQVRLLKRITAALGCDECKHLLQEYEAKIPMTAGVKRRRDFPSDVNVDISHCIKKMRVTVEGNPDTYSLQDVEKIKSALEEATGVSPDVIVLIQSEPGSVVLTFLVPAHMSEYVVNISECDVSLLPCGLLKIEIDDTVIEFQVKVLPQKREVEPMREMSKELSISEKEYPLIGGGARTVKKKTLRLLTSVKIPSEPIQSGFVMCGTGPAYRVARTQPTEKLIHQLRTDRSIPISSYSSILSYDSGFGPSRETSSSHLLEEGAERKRESLVQLVADLTERQSLGMLAEGESKEEECDRLTSELNDSMEQLQEHIKELDDITTEPLQSQIMELPQQLKSRKTPTQLSISLFPPYLLMHTLPSPERPPQEQILRDAVKDNLPRFVRYTNLRPFMVAHLIAKGVITKDAAIHLVLADRTPSQKNLLFYISVVPSAGDNAYSRLRLCLRATADHSGHEELAKLLDEALRP